MKNNKKKILEIASLLILCLFPMIIGTGCLSLKDVECSSCGDDNTNVLCYASGTTEDEVEYTSCMGPAGCIGIGCDSQCWPTECMYVKTYQDGEKTRGVVKFYNGLGCINNTSVKSEGSYTKSATCLGCECAGEAYNEIKKDSVRAYQQPAFLGCGCGEKELVEPKNINENIDRIYPKGCW